MALWADRTQRHSDVCISGAEDETWYARCMVCFEMRLTHEHVRRIYALVNYYHATTDVLCMGGPDFVSVALSAEWDIITAGCIVKPIVLQPHPDRELLDTFV